LSETGENFANDLFKKAKGVGSLDLSFSAPFIGIQAVALQSGEAEMRRASMLGTLRPWGMGIFHFPFPESRERGSPKGMKHE